MTSEQGSTHPELTERERSLLAEYYKSEGNSILNDVIEKLMKMPKGQNERKRFLWEHDISSKRFEATVCRLASDYFDPTKHLKPPGSDLFALMAVKHDYADLELKISGPKPSWMPDQEYLHKRKLAEAMGNAIRAIKRQTPLGVYVENAMEWAFSGGIANAADGVRQGVSGGVQALKKRIGR